MKSTLIVVALFVVALVAAMVIGFVSTPDKSNINRDESSAAIQPSTGNTTNDTLLQLSEHNQATALSVSVGPSCIGQNAFYNGIDEHSLNAFWSLRCQGGSDYFVEVKPDATGTTSVMTCSDISTLAHLNCWQQLKPSTSSGAP